jgi:bifunctional DNase/RNase
MLHLGSRSGFSACLFWGIVAGSGLFSACRSGVKIDQPVEVDVRQVGFDPFSNSHVVILQDKRGKQTMPIWVGISEAQAIELQLHGAVPPRPMTHDLLKNILEQVGVEIDKVLVNELKGSTYYARIHLLNGGKAMEVDSRPSDAIALALRFHRPIFVARALFESMPTSEASEARGSEKKAEQPVSVKFFGMTVQDITGNLRSYFDLPEAGGVLVSEVESESGAGRLQRGDVILAVKGENVRDVAEFRQKLTQEGGRVVTLRVRRDGKDIDVPLAMTKAEAAWMKEEAE